MTQRSSSREQAWAIVIWTILGACIWTGCGPGRTLQLVNGYECYIDKAFIAISPPETAAVHGDPVSDAGEFDQVGDVLFGTRVDWNNDVVIGYFIINTLSHDVQLIEDRQEWVKSLEDMGISKRNIRWPGVFFHGFGFQHVFISALLIVIPTILGFFGIRAIARHEIETRKQKWERL